MLVLIKKLLFHKVKSLGLEGAMKWRQLQEQWDEILTGTLGPAWRGKTKPSRLVNKTLIIGCLNSVIASELRLNQSKILKNIPSSFKKEFETIKFIS